MGRIMTKNAKTKVKDTLDRFLFNEIASDEEYQKWAEDYQLPSYITDNLSKNCVIIRKKL